MWHPRIHLKFHLYSKYLQWMEIDVWAWNFWHDWKQRMFPTTRIWKYYLPTNGCHPSFFFLSKMSLACNYLLKWSYMPTQVFCSFIITYEYKKKQRYISLYLPLEIKWVSTHREMMSYFLCSNDHKAHEGFQNVPTLKIFIIVY